MEYVGLFFIAISNCWTLYVLYWYHNETIKMESDMQKRYACGYSDGYDSGYKQAERENRNRLQTSFEQGWNDALASVQDHLSDQGIDIDIVFGPADEEDEEDEDQRPSLAKAA